jgi:hypothetical protein
MPLISGPRRALAGKPGPSTTTRDRVDDRADRRETPVRVLIVTAGSRGDVAPFTGLGRRLQQAGHQVALAAHDRFAGLVRDSGLEHRALPGDPVELVRARTAAPSPRDARSVFAAFLDELGDGLVSAVAAGADVVLTAFGPAPLSRLVADGFGIPSVGFYLAPGVPTREFAPPGWPDAGDLSPAGNLAAGREMLARSGSLYADVLRRLRPRLGLPAEARAPPEPGCARESRRSRCPSWSISRSGQPGCTNSASHRTHCRSTTCRPTPSPTRCGPASSGPPTAAGPPKSPAGSVPTTDPARCFRSSPGSGVSAANGRDPPARNSAEFVAGTNSTHPARPTIKQADETPNEGVRPPGRQPCRMPPVRSAGARSLTRASRPNRVSSGARPYCRSMVRRIDVVS